MTTSTVTLNVGTGGALPLVDTLTTVDGSAAPASALVQLVKVGYGAASDFKTVTPATPLPTTSINGLVSTANSTSANLAGAAVFTGTWEDVSEYSTVMLSVFASHASATDGLSVQFSSNGTDADLTDVFTAPAATGKIYSFGVMAKFYRIVYTNGATLTTSLRIQSLLSRSAKKNSSQRPSDGRGNDNDFEEMLAYPMKWNGTSWDRYRGDIDQSTPGTTNNVALNGQTVTGTITAAGQTVEIANLRGAATVTLEGIATAVTVHTAAMEVLTAAGTWELAKWIQTTGTAGAIGIPVTAGTLTSNIAANSVRAIADVAGFVGVRFRSVTFTGTSFAVTMVTSYAPTSRIGPDLETTTAKASNITLLAGNTPALATPNTTQTSSGAALPVAALAASPNIAEVGSLARTVTGNSGVIGDVLGGAISGTLNVTVVSGTSPTLDLVLQESPDNGTTWVDVYHCERVTAVSVITLPSVPLNGRRRWLWTIGGTTPSFTFSISVTRGGFAQYPRFVQFFDRTAAVLAGTPINSATPAYQVAGCLSVTATVTIGAATTPATYKLQGSADGTNWFDRAPAVAAVANTTIVIANTANIHARFARVLVSVAGTAQTGTVVSITGTD